MNILQKHGPIPAGYIARNIAPLGESPVWRNEPMPADWNRTTEDILRDGEKLFGYAPGEFLKKQYRRRK